MSSQRIPPEIALTDLTSQLELAKEKNQKLQHELDSLKERFNYVQNATQDAVWDWDLSNGLAWYSDGLNTLFGYNPRDIVDGVKFWYDSIHPHDRDRVTDGIHSIIDKGGKNWHDRYRFQRADGTYAWVFDRGYAIHDSKGKPVRMVGSMQDVTTEVYAREALRESEEKFRGAFDQIAVGISIATPQGKFLSVNKAYPKIFGYAEEELLSKTFSDLSHPDELAEDSKVINDLLSGRAQTVAREKRYIHKSGKIVWGRVFGTVVRDAYGAAKYIVGVLEDISQQREVHQALRQNEERLRLVIDSAKIGTWDFDPRTEALHWDTRCKAMFGMAPDDHADYEVFLQRVHPDDRQAADAANRNAINGIGDGEYDLEYRTIGLRDNKLRWVRAKGRGYKNENGVPIRYTGTVIDITQQKMQEQHLREQEQRFRLLATSIPQIVWTTDAQGKVDYMSEKWQTYTGHTPTYQEFSFRELMHPDDRAGVIADWNECLKQGKTYEGEYRLRHIHTNEYRWFSCTTAPLKDENGKVIKWIGSATDIHDQKMTEIDLENKVAERTRELRELNEQLEKSNMELEQYAYVTSHDLKEPLRKIKIYNNLITTKHSTELSAGVVEYLTKIDSAATRMSGLIDDLLKYSKLADANAVFEPVDLNTIVRNAIAEFEDTIKQKSISVSTGELPVLNAVPVQMRQLFFNLFSNAIKFCKPNTLNKISVTCTVLTTEEKRKYPALTSPGQYFKVLFQDEGIGFRPEYGEQIFTIFQRLNNRSQFEGHGIGLALCRKIVSNHDGYISAEGQENKGATFTIILPQGAMMKT